MGAPHTETAQQARSAANTAGAESRELAQSATESTKQVAQTAKDEAANVVQEASQKARGLADRARSEVSGQVDSQRQRLAGTLRTTGQEFSEFAGGEHSPLTAELARRAAEYSRNIGDYLDRADANRILDDVRSFARRRPGTFLVLAVASGVIAGRLSRSIAAASGSGQQRGARPGGNGQYTYPSDSGLSTGAHAAPVSPDLQGGPPFTDPYAEPVSSRPIPDAPLVDPGVSGRGGTGLSGERQPRDTDVLP